MASDNPTTVTIVVPSGYASAEEFCADCGFQQANSQTTERNVSVDAWARILGGAIAGAVAIMALGVALKSFIDREPSSLLLIAMTLGGFAGAIWRATA